jgi:hypothetical protein
LRACFSLVLPYRSSVCDPKAAFRRSKPHGGTSSRRIPLLCAVGFGSGEARLRPFGSRIGQSSPVRERPARRVRTSSWTHSTPPRHRSPGSMHSAVDPSSTRRRPSDRAGREAKSCSDPKIRRALRRLPTEADLSCSLAPTHGRWCLVRTKRTSTGPDAWPLSAADHEDPWPRRPEPGAEPFPTADHEGLWPRGPEPARADPSSFGRRPQPIGTSPTKANLHQICAGLLTTDGHEGHWPARAVPGENRRFLLAAAWHTALCLLRTKRTPFGSGAEPLWLAGRSLPAWPVRRSAPT